MAAGGTPDPVALLGRAAAQERTATGVEILKSVLLPIVTLVLGYYFARGRG